MITPPYVLADANGRVCAVNLVRRMSRLRGAGEPVNTRPAKSNFEPWQGQ